MGAKAKVKYIAVTLAACPFGERPLVQPQLGPIADSAKNPTSLSKDRFINLLLAVYLELTISRSIEHQLRTRSSSVFNKHHVFAMPVLRYRLLLRNVSFRFIHYHQHYDHHCHSPTPPCPCPCPCLCSTKTPVSLTVTCHQIRSTAP